jgi:hypothetical protein
MSTLALIEEMTQELGIKKSKGESEIDWINRIVLSACSAWLLGIIKETESSYLTVSFVKSRITEKASAYLELFHCDIKSPDNLTKEIVDYVFDTHASAGSFYHKPNLIYPAVEKVNTAFEVEWCRCPDNPLKYSFSGLGTYNIHTDRLSVDNDSLFFVYCLQSWKPIEVIDQLINKRKWRLLTESASREFLHIYRRCGEGYYTSKQPDISGVLLAKEQIEYNTHYILINNGSQYDLQPWEQEECYHEYLALAIMNKHQQLQAEVCLSDELIKLELNYALPLTEERFLRLYAWPHSIDDLKNRWIFTMAPPIYPAVKCRLNHLGFLVKEEYL